MTQYSVRQNPKKDTLAAFSFFLSVCLALFPVKGFAQPRGARNAAVFSAAGQAQTIFPEAQSRENENDGREATGRENGGSLPPDGKGERMLLCGGTPFGVRFYVDGAVISRVEEGSSAEKAGLRQGDLIRKIDGAPVRSAAQILERFAAGGRILLTVRQGQEEKTVPLSPGDDPRPTAGLHLRDSMAGIGTTTFYDPESGWFAGLGHGVCAEGGTLLPLGQGSVAGVRLTSVTPGGRGIPGQLRGLFSPETVGEIEKNTPRGVFGPCAREYFSGEALPAARQEDVKEGFAQIVCTVEEGKREICEVRIEKILSFDPSGRNFLLRVTDERLLRVTGGIVQGMSGSPILQNGKIVGAVTHVLLEDPAKGYGIFIGNMLRELP